MSDWTFCRPWIVGQGGTPPDSSTSVHSQVSRHVCTQRVHARAGLRVVRTVVGCFGCCHGHPEPGSVKNFRSSAGTCHQTVLVEVVFTLDAFSEEKSKGTFWFVSLSENTVLGLHQRAYRGFHPTLSIVGTVRNTQKLTHNDADSS